MAIEREESDWGVRLTARPLAGPNAALTIKAEDCFLEAREGLRGPHHLYGHVDGGPVAAAGCPGVE